VLLLLHERVEGRVHYALRRRGKRQLSGLDSSCVFFASECVLVLKPPLRVLRIHSIGTIAVDLRDVLRERSVLKVVTLHRLVRCDRSVRGLEVGRLTLHLARVEIVAITVGFTSRP